MGKQTKKALNFDFNTHIISDNMSEMQINGVYNKAYYDIKKYLLSNGFEHTQELGYTSIEPMSDKKVNKLISKLTEEIPYVAEAFSSVQITNVGKVYDLTEVANGRTKNDKIKSEDALQREELYEQRKMKIDKDNNISL